MDLTSVKTVKNLLSQRGLRPSKGLGQNFLVNKKALMDVVEAADIQPSDTVLEIGPGLGVLTQELAKKAKKVIAVEKDGNMIEILKETMKDFRNIEIIHGDILKIEKLKIENYKVVGSLPFYLTAPVIRQFLELAEARPPQMTFVVQKEMAQRICSKPPDMNLLAVSVQFYAEPKIIFYISKTSFWPSPEVDAAIIKILSTKSEILNLDVGLFFKIAKAGFSQPRKQIINNLSNCLKFDKKKVGEWLLKNNIEPTQRAETLGINDWVSLVKGFPKSPISGGISETQV